MIKTIAFIILALFTLQVSAAEWEKLPYMRFFQSPIFRLKVPTGWLILSGSGGEERIIFMPDGNHEWKINND